MPTVLWLLWSTLSPVCKLHGLSCCVPEIVTQRWGPGSNREVRPQGTEWNRKHADVVAKGPTELTP